MRGAEGDWSAGSGPPVVVAIHNLGQEDHFLARTIRGIAYVEDVEPVAAKVTLELVAFAKAQGRGRSHDLLADGGRSLKGQEGGRDLGRGTGEAGRTAVWHGDRGRREVPGLPVSDLGSSSLEDEPAAGTQTCPDSAQGGAPVLVTER